MWPKEVAQELWHFISMLIATMSNWKIGIFKGVRCCCFFNVDWAWWCMSAVILALWKQAGESGIQCHPGLHSELEAIPGYKKPCLRISKSKTIVSAKVITQGMISWDSTFPFLFRVTCPKPSR